MKNRILTALFAVVLAVTMLVTSVGAATAADFSDAATIAGWAAEYVDYVAENGLMNGQNGAFNGDSIVTRAQMVQMLYNIEKAVYGEPAVEAEIPFEDVAENHWAVNSIAWAVELGITSGTSATTFSPDTALTRGHLVTFFARYIEAKGLTAKLAAETLARGDETIEVAGYEFEETYTEWYDEETGNMKDTWYIAPAMYALQIGLVGGIQAETEDGTEVYYFNAEGACTRYMAAKLIANLHKYLTLPTLAAEVSIDNFKAEYESYHSDIILAVSNTSYENRGNAELSAVIPSYDQLLALFEEKMEYDHDMYVLEIANYAEFAKQWFVNVKDAAIDLRLVTADGEFAQYIIDVDTIANPYDANKDAMGGYAIIKGDYYATETRELPEVKAEMQADLEATLAAFLDAVNFSTVEGEYEIHIKTKSAHPNVGTRALNRALVEAGVGNFAYRIGPDILSFNTEGKVSIQKPDGTWTDKFEYSDDDWFYAGNSGIAEVDNILKGIAALSESNPTFAFTTNCPIRFAHWGYIARGNADGDAFDANAPVANALVKFVFEYDATVNQYDQAVVVFPGEHKPTEDAIDSLLCSVDGCGAFHYIANEANFDAAQMLADFQIFAPQYISNKYIVTNVVFSDSLAAPYADLETKSGEMTITLADRATGTLTTEYTVPATVTYNATFADNYKDVRTSVGITLAVAKAVGVHPGESALLFDESVQASIDDLFAAFEAKALCACGKVHYHNRKVNEATWSEVVKDVYQGFFNTDNTGNVTSQFQSKYRFYIFSDFSLVTMANTIMNADAYNANSTVLAADSAYNSKVTFAFLDVETMTLTYRTYDFSHYYNNNKSATTMGGEALYVPAIPEGQTMKYNPYSPYYFANKGFMKDGMTTSSAQLTNEDSSNKPTVTIPEGVCPFEYVKASYQASLVTPPAGEGELQ